MALLDDIKVALRVTTSALDSEVETLIGAAYYDMDRVGIDPSLLADADNPIVKQAVTCYCKAHFGYDNDEAQRFDDSYRRIVCDLMNSSANSSARGGR